MVKGPKVESIAVPHNVKCISERENKPGQLTVGNSYIVDLSSVYMDIDGDAYADVYTLDKYWVGRMLLKHFQSIDYYFERA